MTPRRQPPPDPINEDWDPPPGFRYEWAERDDRRLATPEELSGGWRKCRRPGCARPVVWTLLRSNGWWFYCDWHTYGSRITETAVLSRRLVEDAPA